jgi:hypothetical protein
VLKECMIPSTRLDYSIYEVLLQFTIPQNQTSCINADVAHVLQVAVDHDHDHDVQYTLNEHMGIDLRINAEENHP